MLLNYHDDAEVRVFARHITTLLNHIEVKEKTMSCNHLSDCIRCGYITDELEAWLDYREIELEQAKGLLREAYEQRKMMKGELFNSDFVHTDLTSRIFKAIREVKS